MRFVLVCLLFLSSFGLQYCTGNGEVPSEGTSSTEPTGMEKVSSEPNNTSDSMPEPVMSTESIRDAGMTVPEAKTMPEPIKEAQVKVDLPPTRQPVYKDISVQKAREMVEQNAALVILDIRTAREFSAGHLKDAVNIDFYASDFRAQLDKLDKTKVYLVYCAVGGRSASSMTTFRSLGFLEVYNMLGGFTSWSKAGYPSVR